MPEIIHAAPVTPRPQLAVTAQGLIAETFERGSIVGGSISTAQQVRGSMLGLRAGDVVTNLHADLIVAGVGAGYARMALCSLAGVQLGLSGDANAAFTGAAGLLTIQLATPYTALVDVGFYVCTLSNLATTQPSFGRGSTSVGTDVGIGSGSARNVFQNSQASFPSSATFSALTVTYWFGGS